MNQKQKSVGLLAILPLFMVAMAPGYIGNADALLGIGVSVTNVPGAANSPDIQTLEVVNYSAKSPQTFNAVYKITSGDADLENIQILFKSDKGNVQTTIGSLAAHSSSINTVKIQAQDPSSVTAEVISYQINN